MKTLSAFLAIVALIAATTGCAPRVQHNLTISSTEGGSVTSPGEGTFVYDEGTVVNLVAVEVEQGYQFVNWTGDVGTVANVNAARTAIIMNGDHSLTANFVRVYSLTISSTTGGSVTAPGEGPFLYRADSVVSLVAASASGHRFVSWTGNVGTVADVNAASTTITMNSDYSVTANFAEDVGPDFTLPTMTGASITLSELQGTPVVLSFWSISCYWCRQQLPYLEAVAQQSDGEINVMAINMADSAADIQKFFADYEPTMIIALDKNGEVFGAYCSAYSNARGAIPFTLFLDSQGVVQLVRIGAFASQTQLWDTLESLFGD